MVKSNTNSSENLYIIFSMPASGHGSARNSQFWNVLGWFLRLMIPVGNPDFKNKIDAVSQWALEFVDGVPTPNREVGLNEAGEVILKMPYKRNHGYWTDNNLTLPDFKNSFDVREISKEKFRELWKSFALK